MKDMHMKYLKFYTDSQYKIASELFKITRWFKTTEDIQTLIYREINVLALKAEISLATDVYVYKNLEDIEIVAFHKLASSQNEEFKMRMYMLRDKVMFEWMLTGNKDRMSINDYAEFTTSIIDACSNHIGEEA